jgi:hypothetical protein
MTHQSAGPKHAPSPASEEKSPFVTEFFLVQGISFRCMAYFDQDRKWRNAFSHDELPGAIYILE